MDIPSVEPPAEGRCVFCGSDADSMEDVIGKQFMNLLDQPELPQYWIRDRTRASGRAPDLRLPLRRRVCAKCNNGWMHEVDDAMISIAREMILFGTPRACSRETQARLGRWAAKVGPLLMLRDHDALVSMGRLGDAARYAIPAVAFEALRDGHDPPEGTVARVGATDPSNASIPDLWYCGGLQIGRPDLGVIDGQRRPGYVVWFGLGCLVFELMRISTGEGGPDLPPPPSAPHLEPIWPPRDVFISWPPPIPWDWQVLREVTGQAPPWHPAGQHRKPKQRPGG